MCERGPLGEGRRSRVRESNSVCVVLRCVASGSLAVQGPVADDLKPFCLEEWFQE